MDTLIYILIWLSGFTIGIVLFNRYFVWLATTRPQYIMKMMADIHNNEMLSNHPELKTAVEVKMDVDNDMMFLYNKATEEYLSQGKTADDAIQTLFSRFPDTTFFLNDGVNIHIFSANKK